MALSKKEAALRIIQQLPDDASTDDILYALYVRQKIELGLRDIEDGNTVSHEDVMREVDEWSVPRRLVKKGHITVLEPTQPVPTITVEQTNALIEQLRREREADILGTDDLLD